MNSDDNKSSNLDSSKGCKRSKKSELPQESARKKSCFDWYYDKPSSSSENKLEIKMDCAEMEFPKLDKLWRTSNRKTTALKRSLSFGGFSNQTLKNNLPPRASSTVPLNLNLSIKDSIQNVIKSYEPKKEAIACCSHNLTIPEIDIPLFKYLGLHDERWVYEMQKQVEFYRPRLSPKVVSAVDFICSMLHQNIFTFVSVVQTFQSFVFRCLRARKPIVDPLINIIAIAYITGKIKGNLNPTLLRNMLELYKTLYYKNKAIGIYKLLHQAEMEILEITRCSFPVVNEAEDVHMVFKMFTNLDSLEPSVENMANNLLKLYFTHQVVIYKQFHDAFMIWSSIEMGAFERTFTNRFFVPVSIVTATIRLMKNNFNVDIMIESFVKVGCVRKNIILMMADTIENTYHQKNFTRKVEDDFMNP